MADSGSNKLLAEQPQGQSTAEWLYDTAVNTFASFLPSGWSNSSNTQAEQPVAQQQQTIEGPCEKTAAPVCRCKNKNRF